MKGKWSLFKAVIILVIGLLAMAVAKLLEPLIGKGIESLIQTVILCVAIAISTAYGIYGMYRR